MDITAFSADNFDVVDWVNSTFRNSNQTQNKESNVSNIVSKLQLYVQQVNSALEDTSQQVLGGMPRIMKDAQHLQTETVYLKSKMAEVQNDISQVHKDTGACMANLERLDCLKTKLQIAKEGLQESDGWGRLTSELEDLCERNDIVSVCEKLNALQKSLIAQTGLAGQQEREAQVDGFKNRLEALASPAVVQSFMSNDIEQCKKFVKIFSNMDRYAQLTQYYRTVQKRIYQQHWAETVDIASNSNTTIFLREFYEYLFENYQKQTKWCHTVFGAIGEQEPIMVLIELLPFLQPSRETVINNLLKRSDDKLKALQDISAANVHFGRLIRSFLETNPLEMQQLKYLSTAIFDYFNAFIAKSVSFEQQWLATQMSEISLVQPIAADSVRALGSANSKIFEWADAALKRCELITQNCGIGPLVTVYNYYFKSFAEKYKKAQQQLHVSRTIEQDWNLLQTCVSLLQHIGDFRLKLIEFESKVVDVIVEKGKELKQHASDESIDQFCMYKITDKAEIANLQNLLELAPGHKNIESNGSVLSAVFLEIKPICEYVHDTTLASIFSPIENNFKNILPEPLATDAADLPDYSFVPQEFITVVGQYLLTLPQHLEPLLLTPSNQLKMALELCDEKYVNAANDNVPSADVLLSLLSDECCALYEEKIGQICELSMTAAKQLACDIDYLGSVLDELGLSLNTRLQHTVVLLRAPTENYLAVSSGIDPRLVTAIRQIRNIVSKD